MTEQEYLDAIAWASAFSRGEGVVLDPKKTAMRMAVIITEQDARIRQLESAVGQMVAITTNLEASLRRATDSMDKASKAAFGAVSPEGATAS